MNEVRRDATRALLVQDDGLAFDAGEAADARTDRHAGTIALLERHVGEAGILERLTGGVDTIDDEGIDLALHLVVHALGGIEAPGVVRRLHLTRDGASVARGVEMGNLPGAGLAGDQVRPCRFHIGAQRRDETQTGDNYAAHRRLLP